MVDTDSLNNQLSKEVFDLMVEYAPLKTHGGVGKVLAAIDKLE